MGHGTVVKKIEIVCPECEGLGYFFRERKAYVEVYHDVPCPACKGTGIKGVLRFAYLEVSHEDRESSTT